MNYLPASPSPLPTGQDLWKILDVRPETGSVTKRGGHPSLKGCNGPEEHITQGSATLPSGIPLLVTAGEGDCLPRCLLPSFPALSRKKKIGLLVLEDFLTLDTDYMVATKGLAKVPSESPEDPKERPKWIKESKLLECLSSTTSLERAKRIPNQPVP